MGEEHRQKAFDDALTHIAARVNDLALALVVKGGGRSAGAKNQKQARVSEKAGIN